MKTPLQPDPTTSAGAAPQGTARAVPKPELVALFDLFNARRHADMETLACKVATAYPHDGQAWKAWGVSLLAQGKEAVAPLHRAAAVLPRDAEVASSLGGVYSGLGQYA